MCMCVCVGEPHVNLSREQNSLSSSISRYLFSLNRLGSSANWAFDKQTLSGDVVAYASAGLAFGQSAGFLSKCGNCEL